MRTFYFQTKKKSGLGTLYVRVRSRVMNLQIKLSSHIQVDIPTWNKANSSIDEWKKFSKTKDGKIIIAKLQAIDQSIDYYINKGIYDKDIFNKTICDIVFSKKNDPQSLGNNTNAYMNKRPKEPFKTYLMRDNNINLTKIGKSKNPRQREYTLQAEKPTISLFAISEKDVEKELHVKYASKRVRGEWFNLSEIDINTIIENYNFICN